MIDFDDYPGGEGIPGYMPRASGKNNPVAKLTDSTSNPLGSREEMVSWSPEFPSEEIDLQAINDSLRPERLQRRAQQNAQSSGNPALYDLSDVAAYETSTDRAIRNYASLGAQQKASAPTPEFVGVRGAVSVPVASGYGDAKTSLNEIAAKAGDLAGAAKSNNIELCGFLSDLPSIDLDLSAPQLGIPALQDIMKAVNGFAMPILEFGGGAIEGVFGGASKILGDLGSAIQGSIPTITCGSLPAIPPISPTTFASALIPGGPILTTLAPIAVSQIGITPPINITSPDVTVQSLNDVLEAGEF